MYKLFDPRSIVIKKNPRSKENPGFSVEEMKSLRELIRTNGLKQALEIRMVKDKPILIAGERRLRSILGLIDTNAECFDIINNKFAPACEVYDKVYCLQTSVDNDNESMIQAILENSLHHPLTDYEILVQCQTLILAGYSKEEIASKLGKTSQWMYQSDLLINSVEETPEIIEAIKDGILGRSQAIHLLSYPKDKIIKILNQSIKNWTVLVEEQEKEAIKLRDEAIDNWEEHEDELEKAVESGDVKEIEKVKQTIIKDANILEVAEEKVSKAKSNKEKPIKLSVQDIQDAAEDQEVEETLVKSVTHKNIRTVAEKLTIFANSPEDLINPINDEPYDKKQIILITNVLNWILAKNNFKNPLEAIGVEEIV